MAFLCLYIAMLFAAGLVDIVTTAAQLSTVYITTQTITVVRATAQSCTVRSYVLDPVHTISDSPASMDKKDTYCGCANSIGATVATSEFDGAPTTICVVDISTTTSPNLDRLTPLMYSAAQIYNSTASAVEPTTEAIGRPQNKTTAGTSSLPAGTLTSGTASTTQEASKTALGGAPGQTALGTMLALVGVGGLMALLA